MSPEGLAEVQEWRRQHAVRWLNGWREMHAHAEQLGCSRVAHHDLGFCTVCVRRDTYGDVADAWAAEGKAASVELTGWRLLAMTRDE